MENQNGDGRMVVGRISDLARAAGATVQQFTIRPDEEEINRRAADLAEKIFEERILAAIPRITEMIIRELKEPVSLGK